jgi:predicted Zn-dependent protease
MKALSVARRTLANSLSITTGLLIGMAIACQAGDSGNVARGSTATGTTPLVTGDPGTQAADNVPETEPGLPRSVLEKKPTQQPAPATASAKPDAKHDQKNDPRVKELFARAVQLLKENRAFEARSLLEEALRLAPRSAGVHCNLGLAYQNSGNIPRALNEFKQALAIKPAMAEATLNIAGCYQSMGDNLEAIKWYGTYVSQNPQAQQAQQVRDIIKALQQAIKRPGSDPKLDDYFQSITLEGTYRWPRERMPIRVFIEEPINTDGKKVEGFRDSFKASLLEAFDAWSKATAERVTYRVVPTKDQADIRCGWTADPAEVTDNGTQSERGSAKIIVRDSNIERATLKILTKPVLEEAVLSDDELKKACLHEVGHVLGLQGHSTNNHDVMFYTVDTATVWPVLSKRDKQTIAKLYEGYPVPSASAAGKPKAEVH